ncbi:MAG: hypothetical protein IJ025_08905 [Clostridia bacterium]|nr:hypothetical protein [Clostridia bacterium]
MENNNYQPQIEQTEFEQPAQDSQASVHTFQQTTQPNVLPPDIQQRINDVFGKALAAAIMSEFPVASIIAIFFGNNALKEIVALTEICRSMGIRLPGKLVAGRILGIVGKIAGIVYTCIYGGFAVIYSFYFIIIFLVFFADIIGSVF